MRTGPRAPSIRERVLREAAGNPLALVGASGGDAIDRRRTQGPLPDLLPLTARLERTFAARVEDLPAETRALLLAAAIDPACGLQELLTAAGTVVGRPLTVEAIDPAAEAGLVDVDAAAARALPPPADGLGDPSGGVVRRSREGP